MFSRSVNLQTLYGKLTSLSTSLCWDAVLNAASVSAFEALWVGQHLTVSVHMDARHMALWNFVLLEVAEALVVARLH